MERVGSIALKPEQTAISLTHEQHLPKCLELMVMLAEARRESLSKEGLKVYALCLAQYNPVHVQAVLTRLGRTPRAEFEKAIPELGDLEAMVKQEEKASRPKFIPCGKCVGGVVFVERVVSQYEHLPDKGITRFAADCECKVKWRQSA